MFMWPTDQEQELVGAIDMAVVAVSRGPQAWNCPMVTVDAGHVARCGCECECECGRE
jgi:hypothetical protein